MLDTIIRSSRVVTPQSVESLDLGIQNDKIVALATPGNLTVQANRVIDAGDNIVLPGGIEPHAHIGIPVPETFAGRSEVITQPPESATRAAAFGGVTTVLDFAGSLPLTGGDEASKQPIMRQLEGRQGAFMGHSFTDFSFHYILSGPVSPKTIGEIGEAIQSGLSSFKIFTTFRDFRVPYGHLFDIFQEVARNGGIMAVHAEEDDVVNYLTEKLKREGRDQAYNLHMVHNNLSEDLSFRKVIRMAQHAEVGVYFVHVTAKEGVEAISQARHHSLPIYGEATHSYLEFTSQDYRKPDGTKYHTYPALKFPEDRDELRKGMADGRLSTVATDEYTTYKDVKTWGKTIDSVCGGHNGIETRIPVAFTRFVSQGGMSLPRFADIIATNASKIFGMYPQKGVIAPGSDADFVIIDPKVRKILSLQDLHSDSDYSIWDGFACEGYPVMTILRGKVIMENGVLLGNENDGRWLSRKIAPGVLARPVC